MGAFATVRGCVYIPGYLRYNNTRSFPEVLKPLLSLLPEDAQILLSGAGAGKAYSDLHYVDSGFQLDGIGLTPVSPYHHLQTSIVNKQTRISLLDALERADFYTPSNILFIRKQFIGVFPTDFSEISPDYKYDLIFDHFGPLYYADQYDSTKQQIMEKFQSFLSETGIIVFSFFSHELDAIDANLHRFQDLLQQTSGKVFLLHEGLESYGVLFPENHPALQKSLFPVRKSIGSENDLVELIRWNRVRGK